MLYNENFAQQTSTVHIIMGVTCILHMHAKTVTCNKFCQLERSQCKAAFSYFIVMAQHCRGQRYSHNHTITSTNIGPSIGRNDSTGTDVSTAQSLARTIINHDPKILVFVRILEIMHTNINSAINGNHLNFSHTYSHVKLRHAIIFVI